MEVQYLVDHWNEVHETASFTEEMENVAKGLYPHAGQLLSEIFKRVGEKALSHAQEPPK